jgi:hypothetical protein
LGEQSRHVVVSNAVFLSRTGQSSKVRLLSLSDNIPSQFECVHTPIGVFGQHATILHLSADEIQQGKLRTPTQARLRNKFSSQANNQRVETQED